MTHICHVCNETITPDADGRIRVEGITEGANRKAWVWGPVTVHDACRLRLVTPYDDRLGNGYTATWETMQA
jgi:hypothetical protein